MQDLASSRRQSLFVMCSFARDRPMLGHSPRLASGFTHLSPLGIAPKKPAPGRIRGVCMQQREHAPGSLVRVTNGSVGDSLPGLGPGPLSRPLAALDRSGLKAPPPPCPKLTALNAACRNLHLM